MRLSQPISSACKSNYILKNLRAAKRQRYASAVKLNKDSFIKYVWLLFSFITMALVSPKSIGMRVAQLAIIKYALIPTHISNTAYNPRIIAYWPYYVIVQMQCMYTRSPTPYEWT